MSALRRPFDRTAFSPIFFGMGNSLRGNFSHPIDGHLQNWSALPTEPEILRFFGSDPALSATATCGGRFDQVNLATAEISKRCVAGRIRAFCCHRNSLLGMQPVALLTGATDLPLREAYRGSAAL